MHLLVTGGCGFIGSNFIRLALKDSKYKIINLDKLTYAGNLANFADLHNTPAFTANYSLVHGDIGNRELVSHILKNNSITAIVNFAAESHVDRSISDATPFIQTNIQGTQVLLDAARAAKIDRFVQVSTDEVYGSLGPEGRFKETTPLAPNSPYSASKAAADLLVRACHETYGMNTVITRCSNNYGPYQFPEKLIPLMIMRALSDEPLPVYGDGQQVRDWIHVEDHCQGIFLALEKGQAGAVYNFGGAAEHPNLHVVKTILKALNKPESLIRYVTDRPGHDRRYAMDFTVAAKELGYAPAWEFTTGLQATVDWYLSHQNWVQDVQSGAYLDFMHRWYGERL